MVSLTARIALLVYLIGGMAVPAFHRHGADLRAILHQSDLADCGSVHEHYCVSGQGSSEHNHTPAVGRTPSIDHTPAVEQLPQGGDWASAQDCCGDDCVICNFSHSAQRIVIESPVAQWGPGCLGRVVEVSRFTLSASDLSISVPRGPPLLRSALS